MVGGYKIIDFKSINIGPDTPVKIEGVFNEIKNSNKDLRVHNLKISGVDFKPCTIIFNCTDTPYTATVNIGGFIINISITSDDYVTITVNE